MEYRLETLELTLDKLDWARELDLDPGYVELMRSSGGLSSDARFFVVYRNEGPRSDPEVVGYLTTLATKDGKESLSLYRSAEDDTKLSEAGSRIAVVDGDKVLVYGQVSKDHPQSSFTMGAKSVYLPEMASGIGTGDLKEISHKESVTHRTLAEQLDRLGADQGYTDALTSFYGVGRDASLIKLDKQKPGIFDCWPEYKELMANDKEYRMLNIGNYLGGFAEGILEGSLTGLVFEAGALNKLAGFTGLVSKFSPKILNMVTAPIWGKKVDDASEGTEALEKLRSVERTREALFSNTHAAALVAIQPQILGAVSTVVPPAAAFTGLFLAEEITGGIKDAGSHKTQVAIRREILDRYKDEGYDRSLFELIGLEEAVEGGVHMAGFAGGLIASVAAPHIVLPLSLAGLGLYVAGKTMWTCYSAHPDVKLDIIAGDYMATSEGLKFDNGYVLDFARFDGEGRFKPMGEDDIEVGRADELGACYVNLDRLKDKGDWGVIIRASEELSEEAIAHKEKYWNRSILSKLTGNRTLKETWSVEKDILVSRYGGKRDDLDVLRLDDGTLVLGTEGFREAVAERGLPQYSEEEMRGRA